MIWRGSTSSTSSSERAREARATEMMPRRKTRQIQLGTVKVGGDAPITVQSMTKTDTRDVEATLLHLPRGRQDRDGAQARGRPLREQICFIVCRHGAGVGSADNRGRDD